MSEEMKKIQELEVRTVEILKTLVTMNDLTTRLTEEVVKLKGRFDGHIKQQENT